MLTIGYDPDFAPISFRSNAGDADGKAIALLRAACEDAGIACRFEAVPLAGQEDALAGGDVDALAAVAATEERKARYALSRPVMETGAAWFAPLASGHTPFDPEAATDKTPVTTPASGPLARLIAERWPHLTCLPAQSYRDALMRVADGEAVAAALNIDVGRALCERYVPGIVHLPDVPFMRVELALACLKGRHEEVLKRLSAAIEALNRGPST